MKKRILILGGDMFMDYKFINNSFISTNNILLKKLNRKYLIDNFSSYNLDSAKALNYVKLLLDKYDYEKIIIDLDNSDNLVEYLKNRNAELILMNENDIKEEKKIYNKQILSYL